MSSPDGDETEPRRGPGRPRKWANDAERVRAYRARKSEEQASVDELRRDRRALRRQVAGLTAKLERAERTATDAERRAGTLAEEVAKLTLNLESATADATRLHLELVAAREAPRTELGQMAANRRARQAAEARRELSVPSVMPAAPVSGLSRAERRAQARRDRRR